MRPSRLGILLTLIALVATVLAVRVWGPSDDREQAGLSPSGARERPARTHEVPLRGRLERTPGSARSARAEQVRTRRLDVPAYSMVALTWTGEEEVRAGVRTRQDGRWSPWQALDPLTDLGAEEGSDVRGTEPWWADDSDGVQVRVTGKRPADLELVLIDPGHQRVDEVAETLGADGETLGDEGEAMALSAASTPSSSPRPYLHGRRAWGANESWRNSAPVYSRTIKQVHVHHTATRNYYDRGDVPAIIRSMYRYHTQSLGWSDLGYNFLVDRFSRAWVGRAGGYWRPVRGAHTLGFNHNSVGVVVIGSYEGLRPSKKSVTKTVRLAAWKLDKHGRPPGGRVLMKSQGSDRYPTGTLVRLPHVTGHRDTNYTACPGQRLYDYLPAIRRRAQDRADYFS